jgi:hypothetical protein
MGTPEMAPQELGTAAPAVTQPAQVPALPATGATVAAPVPKPPTSSRRIEVQVPARPVVKIAPGTAEAAALQQRIQIVAGPDKNVIVGVQAKIKLTGDKPVSVEDIGVGAEFAEFEKTRAGALGGTGRAAQLPEVTQPPRTPAKAGSQPSSGLVVEPVEASRELEVLAWNTSAPQQGHNVSHAERQFVEWFFRTDPKWRARVETVNVTVVGRNICKGCVADLEWLMNLEQHKHITFTWTRGDSGLAGK